MERTHDNLTRWLLQQSVDTFLVRPGLGFDDLSLCDTPTLSYNPGDRSPQSLTDHTRNRNVLF
jgi:hypothetical protein